MSKPLRLEIAPALKCINIQNMKMSNEDTKCLRFACILCLIREFN